MPREQVPKTLAAFDVALQPAVVDYASPLKLFEYLAVGLPIIAPDLPNIREVLTNAHNALLFDERDAGDFVRCLSQMCNDSGAQVPSVCSRRRNDCRAGPDLAAQRRTGDGTCDWPARDLTGGEAMRDILLTLIVVGALPAMVYLPFVGLLFWMWLGFMNPHRLTWGFAFDFPFVQLAALATILGLMISKESRRFPWNPVTVVWVVLIGLDDHHDDLRHEPGHGLAGVVAVPQDPDHGRRHAAAARLAKATLDGHLVIAGSICFYGVKGGIFTLLTGGQHMVLGPRRSFIGGNTEVAFAIVIALPLLWWVRTQLTHRWLRAGIAVAFALSVISVLGSYSRGAVLAVSAMLGFLWLRSSGKLLTGVVGAAALVIGLSLMPEKWFDRMGTIGGELDRSEQGRINAWWFAYNLANDRPLIGGGFRVFSPEHFQKYAPDPEFFRDAHSIFFEVLGEHGYVGLVLFVLLGVTAVLYAWRCERLARRDPDLDWARGLLRMSQVALVGYVVGGLFLGLAYFDLPYAIMALIVATGVLVRKDVRLRASAPAATGSVRNDVPGAGTAGSHVT